MLSIQLTQDKSTVVSKLDYGYLTRWKWRFKKDKYGGYAVRSSYTTGKEVTIRMHNIVAMRMKIGKHPDHRNQNKLDNRRSNLRPATNSQQGANRKRFRNNESGYIGVHKCNGKWRAVIRVNYKSIHLGYYPYTEAGKKAAARHYNRAARKYFGKFACLNRI